MRGLVFSILFFCVGTALAQLPEPNELLKRGETSSSELSQVFLQIEQNMPSLTTRDSFAAYFEILPQLAELSERTGLETIHPGAAAGLGDYMVAYGIRWLDIANASPEKVASYLQWMSPTTAQRLISYAEDSVLRSKPDQASNIATNLQLIIEKCTSSFTGQPALCQTYREMLSSLAIKQLQSLPLTEREANLFWISKISDQYALSMYVHVLLQKSYLITPMSREELDYVLDYLLEVEQVLKSEKFAYSSTIYFSISDVVIEVLSKSLKYFWPMEEGKVARAVRIMDVVRASTLADNLLTLSYGATPEMDPMVLAVADELMFQLTILGAPELAADFANTFYSGAPTALRALQVHEGVYDLKSDIIGEGLTVSFIKSGPRSFVAVLKPKKSDVAPTVLDTFVFDYENGGILMSASDALKGTQSGWFVRMTFDDKGGLTLQKPSDQGGLDTFEGERVAQVEAPQGVIVPGQLALGDVNLKGSVTVDKKPRDVNVSLMKVANQIFARVVIKGQKNMVDLEGYYSSTDDTVYLTSAIALGEDVVQLRMKMNSSNDNYESTLIRSRTGTIQNFTLTVAE